MSIYKVGAMSYSCVASFLCGALWEEETDEIEQWIQCQWYHWECVCFGRARTVLLQQMQLVELLLCNNNHWCNIAIIIMHPL